MRGSPGETMPSPPSVDFDIWFERLLELVLARHPVDATFLGAHQFDATLPDYSYEADADWMARLGELVRALDSMPGEGLSHAQLYDRILARGALELWSWETSAPAFQSGNPAYHVTQAVAGVVALFEGGELPPGRIAAALARMEAIPSFLETARRRMRSAPLAWTELAIRQAEAATQAIAANVSKAADTGSDIERHALLQAASWAARAFDEHATWLRTVLAERRIAVEPAGTEVFDRYLHLGHLLPAAQDPQWWFDFAHAELVETTTELRELTKAIDWRATWRILLQRLTEIHPGADEYDEAFPAAWERCRAIATEAGLVTWPDLPVCFQALSQTEVELRRVVPVPTYRGAPPLAPATAGWAVYPALDRSLPMEDQQRLLRQMNDARILLDVVIRHAGLGHHVQSEHARHAPTYIGRLAGTAGATRRLFFCGNAVTDGWACYAAELMEEAGALTPLQRLSEAHRRLWVSARAVADIGLHIGELSVARIARLYRDEAGLPATQAMDQAVRDSMNPGIGMAELVGTAGIDELRRAIEDRDGARFDLKGFHDRLLGHGAIPVTLIAASMLETPA